MKRCEEEENKRIASFSHLLAVIERVVDAHDVQDLLVGDWQSVRRAACFEIVSQTVGAFDKGIDQL